MLIYNVNENQKKIPLEVYVWLTKKNRMNLSIDRSVIK